MTRPHTEFDPLSYFKHRRATSTDQARLTRELSDWIKHFSASDHQILRDISAHLKSYNKQAISDFWNATALCEAQEREHAMLMEGRRADLRRQNVVQLRIDGDAMTKELEVSYCSESSLDPPDDVLLVSEPGNRSVTGLRTATGTNACSNVGTSTRTLSSTSTPLVVSTSSFSSRSKSPSPTYDESSSITAAPSDTPLSKISKLAKPAQPAAFPSVNGESNVKFPPEQPMSVYHTLLFRLARKLMSDFLKSKNEQKVKAKGGLVRKDKAVDVQMDENCDERNGANIIDLKDAQVAMSCTLNTMSASNCNYFKKNSKGIISKALALCEIKDFDKHTCLKFLQKYNTPLQSNEAVETLRKTVLRDRAKLLDDDPCPESVLQGKTLRILEHLCEFVLHKPYGTQKPSEHECLNVWATIFGVLTDLVTFHTGEKALEASKIMKRMQREEYGEPSDVGRKVDCVFMFDGIELSNIELKSQNSSPRDVSVQLRKNIRLARCIQEMHISFGMNNAPVVMGDVQGFVGTFYRVVQMGDISVAGEVTSSVVCLPETALALEAFLQDESLALICNFIESLEAQGPVVKTAKDRQALIVQKEKFRSGLRASPGPQRARERKFVNVVTLSPAKKRDRADMESDIASM
ncbi:hypothetical protein EC991_011444 [Linnemannia zychae]|nr:hypothetical protein EC991_011444 [Linnemannia zychae]